MKKKCGSKKGGKGMAKPKAGKKMY